MNGKRGSLSFFTFHLYFSAHIVNNAKAYSQPQPCSLANRFGGEKGTEDFFQVFRTDARAIVSDLNQNLSACAVSRLHSNAKASA